MNKLIRKISRKLIIVLSTSFILVGFSSPAFVIAETIEPEINKSIDAVDSITTDASATVPITKDNYKSWTTATLTEGLIAVENFLKQTPAPNLTWTNGSINTLKNILTLAKNAASGVSEELIREQLIQTVQKLDLSGEKAFGVIDFDNRYANNSLEYLNNYELESSIDPTQQNKKYDVSFILDWSASMDIRLGEITHPRLHAKAMIEAMARKILKENGDVARLRLFAVNSLRNNVETGTETTIQFDTGYFGVKDDYEAIIANAYDRKVRHTNDYIPRSIAEVTDLMIRDIRNDAIPVLFVMSDFQLILEKDVRAEYVSQVTRYKERMEYRTNKDPIYHGVSYLTSPQGYTPEKDKPIFQTDNFRYLEITNKSSSANVILEFTDLLEESLGYQSWSSNINSSNLNHLGESFYSPVGDKLGYLNGGDIYFTGVNIGSAEGTYKTKFKKNQSGSSFEKGDTLPYYTKAAIRFPQINWNFNYSYNPTFFVPVTDLALEIYHYTGVGALNDPKNYVKDDTIVSSNYHSFGGQDFDLKSDRLASIEYGAIMNKQTAVEIVKEKVDASTFSKYNFTNANNITSSSITASYDSTKNVYRLYSSIPVAYGDLKLEQKNLDTGKKESNVGDQIETTVVAKYSNFSDLNKAQLNVALPPEMGKPSKVLINDVLVNDIDTYYVEKTSNNPHGLILKDLQITKGTSLTLKYEASILGTNKAGKLFTAATLTGKDQLDIDVKVSNSIELEVVSNPTVKVQYLDQKGKPLLDDAGKEIPAKIISGELDKEYDVSGKDYLLDLKTYELDEDQLPKNTVGKFSFEEIVVTYVYKKVNDHLVTTPAYEDALSFTWAPKAFDLGERRAVINGNVFNLESESKDKQWIVVNEGRKDSDATFGRHWKVTAKMGVLTADDGTAIAGTKLMMDLNPVQKYNIGTDRNATNTDLVPQDPNDDDVVEPFKTIPKDILLADSKSATGVELLSLTGDNTTEVNVLEQKGDRVNDFRKREGFATKISGQRLVIPNTDLGELIDNPVGKNYKTTITWTLARDF